MKRFISYFFLFVALSLVLVGCGGSPASPTQKLKQQHPCTPSNYYMQCASGAKGQKSTKLSLGAGNQFGIDFAWGGPSGSYARQNGARYGVSYLSGGTSKDWTYNLAHSYYNAGLGVVFVWETSAGRVFDGYAAGASDAYRAKQETAALGFAGAPVFFAVDTDTSGYGCGTICPYFDGAASQIGHNRTGAYGGLSTISTLFNNGRITRGWQTIAWSYGVRDYRAKLYQYSVNDTWHGWSVDYNITSGSDYGQYNPGPPPPPPPPPDPYHYLHFATGPFPSHWGKLNERLQVERYDGARKHPVIYAKYLHNTLEPQMLFLANRIIYLVNPKQKHPNWDYQYRGERQLLLRARSQGKRFAK